MEGAKRMTIYNITQIEWNGRDTSGTSNWKIESNNIDELMEQLLNKGLIHYDNLENELLSKAGKCQDDFEEYEEMCNFIDELNITLTNKEKVQFIKEQNGNAYYQDFSVKSDVFDNSYYEEYTEAQINWNDMTFFLI